MKVLMLSTYMTGGAAACAVRLCEAIRATYPDDVTVNLLTRKGSHSTWVHTLEGTQQLKANYSFYMERLTFWPHERDKSIRWAYSLANTGVDISEHPLVKEADVIHLHWINHGYLSLDTIAKLTKLNKPVVWSMHDMWTFTGGCHYARTCTFYKKQCGNCIYLKKPGDNDLSAKLWKKKMQTISKKKIQFVASSKWLRDAGRSSHILKEESVIDLVTPVDTNLFKALDKPTLRAELGIGADKKVILFLAMSVKDKRKGFIYLKDALKQLEKEPNASQYEVLVLGKGGPEMLGDLSLKVHLLGLVSDKARIAEAYNAADVFVIPSLEDNLPNTVMESLACGLPSVGFNTGGIPEMIDHGVNGYIAKFKDVDDLAKGIRWVLEEEELSAAQMKENALNKAINTYSKPVVAKQYIELYKSLLGVEV